MTNPIAIRSAIISVSDKTGVAEFAKKLRQWNITIISTGGTLKALREAGIEATSVSEITGFPEILDGRVKTLHPKIHAGLLAVASNQAHVRQLQDLHIAPIDLVVVNLYPFEETIQRDSVSTDEAVEQIDIGGPTMLRAAAKNFKSKAVIVNPDRYREVISELEAGNGSISEETRLSLAREAFLYTSRYDSLITNYLTGLNGKHAEGRLPNTLSITLKKSDDLRYGENPHQSAALYGDFDAFFRKLHGKELSFNNIMDIQAAAELVEEFDEPTAVIVKHTNPCGVGCGNTLTEAYERALATDQKSAFGGIVCFNRPLDLNTVRAVDKIFTEVVIAPSIPQESLTLLQKKKDRRLIEQSRPLLNEEHVVVKTVAGGVMVQSADDKLLAGTPKVVTRRAPTDEEVSSLLFGWRVAKHVKSNAIVYTKPGRTVGIGAGQMSRVDSSRIAALKAREAGLDLTGTSVASDAFFPFADGLLEAVNVGATAVIQPGGSVRDEEVIRAADEHNIAMLFTGMRHFRH